MDNTYSQVIIASFTIRQKRSLDDPKRFHLKHLYRAANIYYDFKMKIFETKHVLSLAVYLLLSLLKLPVG